MLKGGMSLLWNTGIPHTLIQKTLTRRDDRSLLPVTHTIDLESSRTQRNAYLNRLKATPRSPALQLLTPSVST